MTYRAFTAILAFLAVVGLLAITLAAVAVQRATPPPDALPSVAAIHLGAPRSALVGFSCYSIYVMGENFCQRDHADGALRSIIVSLQGDTIRYVSVLLRDIHLDELRARYGRPVRLHSYSRFVRRWCYPGGITAVVYGHPFGALASTHVSYSPSRQSC